MSSDEYESSSESESSSIYGGDDDLFVDDTLNVSDEDEAAYTSSEEESSTDDEEDYFTDEEEETLEISKKLTKVQQSNLTTKEKNAYMMKNIYTKYLKKLPKPVKTETHNVIKIVDVDKRITSNTISIYEAAEMISHRAKQIEEGCKVYTPQDRQIKTTSSIDKAFEEFKERRIPLLLMRPIIPNKVYEVWDPKTMDFPSELELSITK